MNLRDQLTSVQNQLAEEKSKVVDRNADLIAQLEAKEADLQQAIMVEDQNQAAADLRIQDATEQAAYFLDNLVIEGLTMRELCVDEPQYQMLRIAVQTKIIQMAEEYSQQISDNQQDENLQKSLLKQQLNDALQKIEDNDKEASAALTQSKSETADYQSKLKNATDEIDRLNSQIDDLRKEIAVGARNAYKVTDVEQTQQLKQLADQIKAARIHVYDVTPDSVINPKNYTATRADNGQPVTYNWTQAKNYIEIKDPNEVEQFRQQFDNQNAVPDISLAEPVQDSVTEVPLPEIPSVEIPEVRAVSTSVASGTPETTGQGQTVEERLTALEKRVVELETVCNVNESGQAVA